MNSLDLLILAVMGLCAVSLAAMVLMFLLRNEKAKRVCLYLVAALGVYLGVVGLQILWPMYTGQCAVAVLAAAGSVGAVVLERLSRKKGTKLLPAQLLASASVAVGLINAFVI